MVHINALVFRMRHPYYMHITAAPGRGGRHALLGVLDRVGHVYTSCEDEARHTPSECCQTCQGLHRRQHSRIASDQRNNK